MFLQIPNLRWLDVRWRYDKEIWQWETKSITFDRDNHLTTLPVSITQSSRWILILNLYLDDEDSYQLFSLMTLLLDDNLIDELPCILGLVPDLQNVTFRGNLLSSPPQDILDLGWKGIKQYFNQRLQFTSTWDNNSDNMKVNVQFTNFFIPIQ